MLDNDEKLKKREKLNEIDSPVKAPADFTSPDELYKELIQRIKKYHPSTDISMIEKAYSIICV